MLAHAYARPKLHWLARVLTTLTYTGMRIGEVAQLEWRDVDMEQKLISVSDESRGASAKSGEEARETKSGRGRFVPMHQELHRALSALPAPHTGRVFFGPRGGKLKPDTVRNVFIRHVLKPIGVKL